MDIGKLGSDCDIREARVFVLYCLTKPFKGAIRFAAERQHIGDVVSRIPRILIDQLSQGRIGIRRPSQRVVGHGKVDLLPHG